MKRDTKSTTGETAKAEETRAEIVMHAVELFKHYGFWKTNIGDIAGRCCMSPGNLYRYFRNKQAIGLACVSEYFESVQASLETVEMLPGGTAEERIRKWLETGVRHLVDEYERHPKIVELAEFLTEDPEGIKVLQSHLDWKRVHLAREIEKGVASGQLVPCEPESAAAAILNALKAFWMPMTIAKWRDKSSIIPELHQILDIMFSGLKAR